jgi:gamma-glutamylcyclotransferase (GGCT)/AIG2-like uncharacterized protein YtfP
MNNTASAMARYLQQNSDFVGEGTFPGRLYDLGSYPGAVYEAQAATQVFGHILRLHDPEKPFKILDLYEGITNAQADQNEYWRTVIPVNFNNQPLDCWVYLYNFATDKLPEISGGNYLHYLNFIKIC